MKYLCIGKYDSSKEETLITNQVLLPDGMTDEQVIELDDFLRQAGILNEDTELFTAL